MSILAAMAASVVWYTAMNTQDAEPLRKRFEEKYPGTTLTVLRQPGEKIRNRIVTEARAGKADRASVYVEGERQSPRAISHLAIRTLDVEKVTGFYQEVFGLTATEFGLTDGRVSLLFMKERLASVGDDNPHLRPMPLGAGSEGVARLKLFATCPCGSWQLADPDGILIDLSER